MIESTAAAETLAGAIALGEATDQERDAYRRHLAVCRACLDAFGGEREIERVMARFRRARRRALGARSAFRSAGSPARKRRNAWSSGFGAAAAAALAASLGLHALVAGERPLRWRAKRSRASRPRSPSYGPIKRVTLERAPGRTRLPAPQPAPQNSRRAAQRRDAGSTGQAVPRDRLRLLAEGRAGSRLHPAAEIAAAMLPTAADEERSIAALQTTESEAAGASEQAESMAIAPVRFTTSYESTVKRPIAPRPPPSPARTRRRGLEGGRPRSKCRSTNGAADELHDHEGLGVPSFWTKPLASAAMKACITSLAPSTAADSGRLSRRIRLPDSKRANRARTPSRGSHSIDFLKNASIFVGSAMMRNSSNPQLRA